MSGARFSEDLKPLSPGQRLREAVNVARQNALATLVQESAAGRYIRGGPGVRVSTGPQGTTIKLRKEIKRVIAPGAIHNWQPTRVDSTHITLSPGTFNDATGAEPITPTIGGNPMTDSPAPQVAVHATDLRIIYLKITIDSLTLSNDFVVGYTQSAVEITAEATEQTSDSSTRWFELFRWQAGALTNQTRRQNIGLRARDDGTATSTPVWLDWLASS